MFFVFMPLLVIWLNENKVIVEHKILHPFEISSAIKAKYILEIPLNARVKNAKNIKKGAKIDFRI